MERNKFDKKDCLEMGTGAEEKFSNIAEQREWIVKRGTKAEDINEHWEFEIEKGAEKYKVDVKAMKRMRRSDKEVQDEWIWLELHSVRAYNEGWIYGAKSDLIAFEKKDSFVIVKRSDLIELIPKIINLDGIVANVTEAKYRVYQRAGRPDKISLIELAKLEPIKWDEWEKT